jgi:RimJ/RimL family protein N-acetyltransferase
MDISLKKIKENDFLDIYNLTKDYKIMKWVGNRKPWTKKKVKNFISYNKKEEKEKDRRVFYWKIVNKKDFIGIIGIHKYENEDRYYITIFIKHNLHGKGYATKSMIIALQEFHKLKKDVKYIYSQSLQNNKKIEGLLKKISFKKIVETVERLGKKYNIYKSKSLGYYKNII